MVHMSLQISMIVAPDSRLGCFWIWRCKLSFLQLINRNIKTCSQIIRKSDLRFVRFQKRYMHNLKTNHETRDEEERPHNSCHDINCKNVSAHTS